MIVIDQLSQPLMQLGVLLQNSTNRAFELGITLNPLLNECLKELFDRDPTLLSSLLDLRCSLVRKVDFKRFHRLPT
ncbi:MAG TPA: hypothetical protein VN380_22080 [Thermoanaerobaculia bacterium]|jgi:hypothetical protein|nr:hypothetical protein [Thermoanaerobaculia bacterium]